MSAPAPDYKQNPSIDGTTVNNSHGHPEAIGQSSRQGKNSSPDGSDGSEDIYRNVTEDTPRVKRSAPPPGVMVG
jgi:hypothetical protein